MLVQIQQGSFDDAQPRPHPAFDEHFRMKSLPAAQKALQLARWAPLEVIHTVIVNLTADGPDRSADDKRCGLGFARGSRATEVIAELAQIADELVLVKSSS
jgi:nicotinamidase-related amidase